MADHRTLPRRRHSRELKAQVLAECAQSGASVAGVAFAHGLNANVVHECQREAARIDAAPVTGFIPLALPVAPSAAAQADIHIELQRGATRMAVTWPAAASDCAARMRELLK